MKIFIAAFFALAAQSHAYVTSAILEYMADDRAGIFLNGSTLLERSQFCPFDYNVLSTSDGTMPMELFNNFGDNVLGIVNYDTKGGSMLISYRFTVHQSEGDPIVIWSVPEQGKMFHLKKEQRPPVGWETAGFNDSAWTPAVQVTTLVGAWVVFPRLIDPTFAGFAGIDPYVPALSHVFNASATTGDHNYFRSRFKFPDKPAKVQLLMNPAKAVAGQKVAVRLIPGPDTTEFTQFNILAWVPKGVQLNEISKGGQYDAKLGRIAWNFGAKDLDVRYSKMGVKDVVKDGGWANMHVMKGREKQGKGREQLNTPQYLWDEGAVMSPNRESWFKMEPHGVDLSQGRPLIKGVILHSQIKLGGQDNATARESDFVRFNYSVDGTFKPALKSDVNIARMTSNQYWVDGYYDLTEDREWTWEDLSKLMVRIVGKPKGAPDKNRIASAVITVKYFRPSKASPYFFATVTDPACTSLKFQTGIFRAGSPLTTSDDVVIPINEAKCKPTPVPTPTFTEVPRPVIPTPQPTKEAGLAMSGQNYFRMSQLRANPDPVNFAGTFLSYNIKKAAEITVRIFSSSSGQLVRTIKAGSAREGDQQVFFNALDDQGKLLLVGTYLFEVQATGEGHREIRNGNFTFVKKKR